MTSVLPAPGRAPLFRKVRCPLCFALAAVTLPDLATAQATRKGLPVRILVPTATISLGSTWDGQVYMNFGPNLFDLDPGPTQQMLPWLCWNVAVARWPNLHDTGYDFLSGEVIPPQANGFGFEWSVLEPQADYSSGNEAWAGFPGTLDITSGVVKREVSGSGFCIIQDPAWTGPNPFYCDAFGNEQPTGTTNLLKYKVAIIAESITLDQWSAFNSPSPPYAVRPFPAYELVWLTAEFTVQDPYTDQASIYEPATLITSAATPLTDDAGEPFVGFANPTATRDGRLMALYRVSADGGQTALPMTNIVYTFNENPGPSGWQVPAALSDMHANEVNRTVAGVPFEQRYPVAMYPIKDSLGNPVPTGFYNGDYPWITPEGDLFCMLAGKTSKKADRALGARIVVGEATRGQVIRVDVDGADGQVSGYLGSYVCGGGFAPGMWSPFGHIQRPDVDLPARPGRLALPLYGSGFQYTEASFEMQDDDYVLFLKGTPALVATAASNYPWRFVNDLTRTADVSGNFNTADLLSGARTGLGPSESQSAIVGIVGDGYNLLIPGAHVRVPGSPSIDQPDGALTAELFVSIASEVSPTPPYSLLEQAGRFALRIAADGSVEASVALADGRVLAANSSPLPMDTWVHVALTYDSSTVRLVFDGVEVAATAGGAGTPLDLGRSTDVVVGPFPGYADEVALSIRAKSLDDLKQAAYVPLDAPALIGFGDALPAGLDPEDARVPIENPWTPEAQDLGDLLFHDPALSLDGSVSCATCHIHEHCFTDGLPLATGIFGQVGTVNTPTIQNRLFSDAQFFDGRASSLEEQVLAPISNPVEMGNEVEHVLNYLQDDSSYPGLFANAFPAAPWIDGTNLARALATYIRGQNSGSALYDAGVPTSSGSVKLGETLFFGRARCVECHPAPYFTDESFHATGVSLGAVGRFAETGRSLDLGATKTPTLRNVAHTAPYFSDGHAGTLAEVIEFYDAGGVRQDNQISPYPVSPRIRPLGLTAAEKAALVDFLLSGLTGTL